MDQTQSSCAGGANAQAEMASAGRQRDDGDQGTVYSVWRLSSARTTVALPSGPRSSLALDMHHLCNLNYPAWVPACHVKTAGRSVACSGVCLPGRRRCDCCHCRQGMCVAATTFTGYTGHKDPAVGPLHHQQHGAVSGMAAAAAVAAGIEGHLRSWHSL